MITVEYDSGRCQILRDGVQLCDLSIDEAQSAVSIITRDSGTVVADSDLYDAYLLGCEDECRPEPKTLECFMEGWNRGA